MNVIATQEFLLLVLGRATTSGLRFIADNPERLIWGAFTDADGNGCVYHWLGLHHRRTRKHPFPGVAFLRLCGIDQSNFITCWDDDPRFRQELLEAVRLELFYREPHRAARPAGTVCEAGVHRMRAHRHLEHARSPHPHPVRTR